MKKSAKLATTLLAALVITACGSSGGKSDNTANTNTNTNTNTPTVVPSSDSTGAVIVLSGSGSNFKVETKKLKDTNLNFITVDGKAIRVAHTDLGIYSGTWTSIRDSFATCCGKFSDVRFGLVDYSEGPEENGHIFYNGNPSKTVPTSGKANYSGYFVVAGQTTEFDEDDFLKGDATFAADFGNKTLSGTLTQETLKPINVNATIAGNSFTGSANSATFSTKANVEGKFFGNNAKELGGIFTDGKTWGGAFGAVKQ